MVTEPGFTVQIGTDEDGNSYGTLHLGGVLLVQAIRPPDCDESQRITPDVLIRLAFNR